MDLLDKLSASTTLFSNPLNLGLLAILLYTSYPLLPTLSLSSSPSTHSRRGGGGPQKVARTAGSYNWMPVKGPEALVWRTYTPLELRSWDGRDGGRILVGINRLVYDLTTGRNFYGPDGPYGNFAGRDASRGLAKQSFDEDMLTPVDAAIDPLTDLTASERGNLAEWEAHFRGKYIVVGDFIENSERALRPL